MVDPDMNEGDRPLASLPLRPPRAPQQVAGQSPVTWSVLEPWLPPERPDLARLAMEAADAAGLVSLRAWPEVRKGGIAFGELPPFLCWRGWFGKGWQLILMQPREIGALVPGARRAVLPEKWLMALDLPSLARPLALHPDFPGGTSVQVVHLPEAGHFQVRTHGEAAPDLVAEVLRRVSSVEVWSQV